MDCAALFILCTADEQHQNRSLQDGSYLHHTALLEHFSESFYLYRPLVLGVMIALNLNKDYLTDNVQISFFFTHNDSLKS